MPTLDVNPFRDTFVDEIKTNVGASYFTLNNDWFVGSDLVISTASGGGGTLLILDIDYELAELNFSFSVRIELNVYHQIRVVNVAYQATTLYFTGQSVRTKIDVDESGEAGGVSVRENFTASEGQTVFTTIAAYTTDKILVYKNGLLQKKTDDYTETDSHTITFTYALVAGDKVTFFIGDATLPTTVEDLSVPLPIGTILMYDGVGIVDAGTRTEEIGQRAGDLITMPGWYSCNGNSGTPNLLNKFVRAMATSGSTGGSDTHVLTIGEMPAHDHPPHSTIAHPLGQTPPLGSNLGGSAFYLKYGIIASQGGGAAHENRPAYYSLIFIKKIDEQPPDPPALGYYPKIRDADGDTKIETELSADEDKVRIYTGGTERAVIDSNGINVKPDGTNSAIKTYSDGAVDFPKQSAVLMEENSGYSDSNNTTIHKVTFSSELFDIQGEGDLVNDKITVEKDGIYIIAGECYFSSTGINHRQYLTLYKNGAGLNSAYHSVITPINTDPGISTSIIMKLNANDYIELYIFKEATCNVYPKMAVSKIA